MVSQSVALVVSCVTISLASSLAILSWPDFELASAQRSMSISRYQQEERTGYMRPTLDTLTRRLFGTSGHT